MPITTKDPLAFFDLADTLRACVEDRLDEPVIRSCVITGEVAWDECECGQLVVSLQRQYPTSSFPNEGGDETTPQSSCGSPLWVGEFNISILRCSPETDTAAPPACSELGKAANLSIRDGWAANAGAWCCLKDLKNNRDVNRFEIGTTTYVGAAGLCQGSSTIVRVGVINACLPCDDDGPS